MKKTIFTRTLSSAAAIVLACGVAAQVTTSSQAATVDDPAYCINEGWRGQETEIGKDSSRSKRISYSIRHNNQTGEEYAVVTGEKEPALSWIFADYNIDITDSVKYKNKNYPIKRIGDGDSTIFNIKTSPVTGIKITVPHHVCIAPHAAEKRYLERIKLGDAKKVTFAPYAVSNLQLESLTVPTDNNQADMRFTFAAHSFSNVITLGRVKLNVKADPTQSIFDIADNAFGGSVTVVRS